MTSAADIRSAARFRARMSEGRPSSDESHRAAGNAASEQQRRLYEAILANTPDLAYVFDLNHRFIYANEGLLKMWGRTWTDAIGKNCLELGYEPWHAAMHDREIEQVIATKQPVRGVVPFTGTFGRRIYDYIFVPVIGPDGRVEAVAGTTRDVTDFRQQEEALRESEERLSAELEAMRQLQAISTQLVHERDTQALYEKIIDAAVSIMRSDFASMQMYHPERGERGELQLLAFRGFDPEAAKFWEWVRADSGCTCGEALRTSRRAIAENVATCEFMAGTDDQAAYLQAGMYAAQSTPLFSRSGRLLGMLSTHWREPHHPTETDLQRFDILARQAADLIERVNIETALRQREERFRALVTATADVVYRMSADWNEMHHLDGKEFIADTHEPSRAWLDKYIHPDDQPLVTKAIDKAIRTKSVFQLEHRVLRVDGTLGWTSSRAIPVLDEQGEIVEWFGAASDITERKRAEESLKKSEADLRLRNAELARFNRAMVDRELRMIELKKEINELCRRQGEPARYPLDFEQDGRQTHG